AEHRLRLLAARARAVHEDRDLAEALDGLFGQLFRVFLFRQVELDVGAHHPRSLGFECVGHALADAVPGAGDERRVALQQHQVRPALARFAARRSRVFAVSTTKRTCLPRPHCSTASVTENSNTTLRRSISTTFASIVTFRPSGVAARWSIDT